MVDAYLGSKYAPNFWKLFKLYISLEHKAPVTSLLFTSFNSSNMLIHQTCYLIKRKFHFHVATHVICPWRFTSFTSFNFFISQLGYLHLFSTNYMCCRSLTSFNCFFKPIRIPWSDFYQLIIRTYDINEIGGMEGGNKWCWLPYMEAWTCVKQRNKIYDYKRSETHNQ